MKCFLWHKYREIRVLELRTEFVTMSLDGDVCARCGKLHPNSNAHQILAMWRATLPYWPIVIHPSVQR